MFTILLLHALQLVRCLHLVHVEIPEFADIRDVVSLSCSYNMGKTKLNSVKWYKDNQEFFRYAPLMDQQISLWTVDGVNLYRENPHNCNKQTCTVSLDNLSSKSSGVYRCEISADAPSFGIVYSDQKMRVVALPNHDPSIQGLRTYYIMGDIVAANCTSDASYPPATLTWFINDEKVTGERALISQYETTIDAEDFILRSRTMQIRFHLDEQHFGHVRRQIFLKCVANIEQIPNRKRQTSELVYIQSDDLQNLRLINSQHKAVGMKHRTIFSFIFVTSFMKMILFL